MNRSHSFQNLIDTLAPEVEAPRPDSFGLAALEADRRRARIERGWNLVWKIGFWAVMLLVAAVLGANSRLPERSQFVAQGSLTRTCAIDARENCLVCRFTDAQGRERHKSAHCPALAPSGMMAWPLEAKR